MSDDFNLAEKVNPLYIVDDFLDQHPVWFDRSKNWWVWSREKKNWRMMDDTDIYNLIYRELDEAGIVNNKLKGKYLTAFQMMAREREPEEMPKDWVQFKDCVYDIGTGKTMEVTPDHFFTNQVPWRYHSDSKECPTIDRLFEEWVGKEQKPLLYELCAYCLLSDYPINRIFCLLGGGRNGKSSFMRLLTNLVGRENTTSTSLERLIDRPFECSKLYRKLVAYISETNYSVLSKTNLLKEAVGKDPLPGEMKNKTPFEFENYAKVIISTNSLPVTGDKTIGFYSKWVIIDFSSIFEVEKDVLKEVPDSEYEALARRCVEMLPALIERGRFTNEGSYLEKMEKYEEKSNPISTFMDEEMEKGSITSMIPLTEFTERLHRWLENRRFRRMSQREITRQLKDEGIEVSRGNYYEGEERRQLVSIFGYVWKEKGVGGSDGSHGSHVSLSSLYRGMKSNHDTEATNATNKCEDSQKCQNCESRSPELMPCPDRFTPGRTLMVCLACYKEATE